MVTKLNIEDIFVSAEKHHKQNNFLEAKKLYESVLEIEPDHLKSIFRLGSLFAQINNFDRAKYFLNKAIKIEPNYSKAHNNLGIVFNSLKEYQKAKDCYERSIKINPKNEEAYNNLGLTLYELGEFEDSIKSYYKAIEINPEYQNAIKNISILLRFVSLDLQSIAERNELIKLFLLLYRRNDIEHKDIFPNAKKILLTSESYSHLEEIINFENLLEKQIIKKLLKEELFLLILQKNLISDIFLEQLLTKIRFEILSILINKKLEILKDKLEFVVSLAEQCFLNEYCFFQSNEELDLIDKLKINIENKKYIDEIEIAVLGCYIPLTFSETIVEKLLNYKSKNHLFNDLIKMQISEPIKEKNLLNSINSLKSISDPISKKVREQYEENPFPRWRYTYKEVSSNSLVIINNQIRPNKIDNNDKFNSPNVLIAGCGTGKQIFISQNYLNAKILAVDLSKKSLAYAKRKIQESRLNNIEFLHGDILDLNNFNTKFDIIECIGVLHHMKSPLNGLKVLLNLLKPHGLMKLGLYSDIARKSIKNARQLIIERNYKNKFEDIINFRQEIIKKDKDEKISKRLDFYSTSGVRDLLFHVQEQRFTILDLSKIMLDFNLEFLGFSDINVKNRYSELYPEDKKNILLDNWYKFEIENNDAFAGMYNFWVRKKL